MGRIVVCRECGEEKPYYADGMCGPCYERQRPLVVCGECGEMKPHKALGLCTACYARSLHRTNPGPRRASSQRWKHGNKEHIVEYNRQYQTENRENLSVQRRDWRQQNPDRNRLDCHLRRARKAELPATLTPEEWEAILLEYDYSCAYCGTNNEPLEQEHKTPLSRGGGYTRDNIVPACKPCNRQKFTKTYEEFITGG